MVTNGQINPTGDDWELIVDLSRSKLQSEKQIPKLILDVSLNSNFIAVEILTSNSRSNWVAGGYIAQTYELEQFELTPPQYFVAINQVNLVELKQIANLDFGLVYDPPKYFNDIQLRIWKYTGIETNLLLANIAAALNNISVTANVDLSEVNQKLDRIIEAQNNNVSVDFSEIINRLNAIQEQLNSICQPPQPPQSNKKKKFFLIN